MPQQPQCHGRPMQDNGVAAVSRSIRIMAATLAACAGLLRFTDGMPAAPGDAGRVAFNNSCRTCHSMKANDNRLGPSLNGSVQTDIANGEHAS